MSPSISKLHFPFSLLMLFALLFGLTGCGKKGDPSPTAQTEPQRVTILLKSATWKMQSLSVDGVDQSDLFNGLTINFADNSFTTTNGSPVWPASSSWTFVDDQATSFKRMDGIVVTIQFISATSLKLGLTWKTTTLGSGKVRSVSGQNVFTFVP